MVKYLLAIGLLIFAVSRIDLFFAERANQIILSENAFLTERLESTTLDFEGNLYQECLIDKIYYVYHYQTCFRLERADSSNSQPFFRYIYHEPKPILYFYGHSVDSLYFSESRFGKILNHILIDHSVVGGNVVGTKT